jgi:hypothetical protein
MIQYSAPLLLRAGAKPVHTTGTMPAQVAAVEAVLAGFRLHLTALREILQAHRHRKVMRAAMVMLRQTLRAAAAVAHLLLVQTQRVFPAPALLRAMAAAVLHRQSLARPLLMQAVVVAALGPIRIQAVLEALAVVPQEIILPLQITVLLTQVVAAAQDRRLAVEPAALASSSLNTLSPSNLS